MSSSTGKKNRTRRAFFSDVTASTALAAVAMTQLGSQTAAMAQEKKESPEGLRMPKNLPPGPKELPATNTTIYSAAG